MENNKTYRLRYTVVAVLIIIASVSCTNNPVADPERTSAKANQDQVKSLDSINETLKRIASALEQKSNPK